MRVFLYTVKNVSFGVEKLTVINGPYGGVGVSRNGLLVFMVACNYGNFELLLNQSMTAYGSGAVHRLRWWRIAVYGLLLIASTLLMTDMARLRQYIRPLRLAYVDAGP